MKSSEFSWTLQAVHATLASATHSFSSLTDLLLNSSLFLSSGGHMHVQFLQLNVHSQEKQDIIGTEEQMQIKWNRILRKNKTQQKQRNKYQSNEIKFSGKTKHNNSKRIKCQSKWNQMWLQCGSNQMGIKCGTGIKCQSNGIKCKY